MGLKRENSSIWSRCHAPGVHVVATDLPSEVHVVLRLAGGREKVLGELQSMGLLAGANALIAVPPGEATFTTGSRVDVEVLDWERVAFGSPGA